MEKGIHILDGFPCFMTEAHTAQDINLIIGKFEESVNEMLEAGFFSSSVHSNGNGLSVTKSESMMEPPIEGARLGKDKDGNPAWFITDPARPGKYLQVK